MQRAMVMAMGAVLALAACGKPAAVQPEPQVATEGAAAAVAVPDAMPPATAADGFPAVPSPEEVAAAAAAAGLPVTPEQRLKLVCDSGEKLVVRFFPEQGIAVLVRAGQNIELNQEPSGSGIRYSNGTTTLTGKGDDHTVQFGTTAPMRCMAA